MNTSSLATCNAQRSSTARAIARQPRASLAVAARILVVDDTPSLLSAQRLHLENAGYRVTTATSAAEALQAVWRQVPDLVLSDVMMPGTDGFQLCRALRSNPATRSLPVVLTSGHYGDPLDLRHAAHCGANMFVSRADGPESVLRAVGAAFAHPETRLDLADDAALDAEYHGRLSVQLDRSQQQYRAILEGMADGVLVTDGEFRIRDANPAAEELSGYTLEEARGLPLLSFVSPQEHARVSLETRRYLKAGRSDGDFQLLRKDGSTRQVHFTGHRVRPGLFLNIIRDVTVQRRNEELLRLLAYTDPVTGLANRTAFEQGIEQAAANAIRSDHAAGLLVLSLGNFREINNTLGSEGGDRVLCETAARVRTAVAGMDVVAARLGASRFAVLLPRLDDAQHLARTGQALLSALAAPITVDGIPVEAAACVGAAQCPDDAIIGSELLRRAGVALRHARAHQLSYAGYHPDQDPMDLQQLTLVSELRNAIAHNQLELWYQPKLDLRSGRVDSVEALVRWRHPERGLIAPDDFIPVAERTGLIHLLTGWVLTAALHQSKLWRDKGLCLNVAINISQHDLREDSFPTLVRQQIEVHGVPASSVTLEVTEGAVMQDPARAVAALGELRKHGVRISLDDFGTGQASLAHLHQLPLDEIKLDKSFVLKLPNGHGKSIAVATAMLAREFGLKSVAEGMESADCQLLLGELGFDRVQGYHLSKPLPAAKLESWIAERNRAAPADREN